MPYEVASNKGGIGISYNVKGSKCPYCTLNWYPFKIRSRSFDGDKGFIDGEGLCPICGAKLYYYKSIKYELD